MGWDPTKCGDFNGQIGDVGQGDLFFPPEMRISGGHLGDSTRCSQCLVSSLVWTRRAIQQPEAPPAGTVYFIQCWDFPNIQCIFFRPKILSPHQPKRSEFCTPQELNELHKKVREIRFRRPMYLYITVL